MIRSGFAINYDETKIHLHEEVTKGVQKDVDQISIFTDQAETDYFTLYRKPYQSEGELSDTAQLYLRFKTGKEVPLHSSEVVVEDFEVKIPKDPRDSGDSDIQPYVSLYLRFRQRHPSGEIPTESQMKDSEPMLASYSTTLTLRNTSPASYKNPLSDPSFSEMMKFNPVQ